MVSSSYYDSYWIIACHLTLPVIELGLLGSDPFDSEADRATFLAKACETVEEAWPGWVERVRPTQFAAFPYILPTSPTHTCPGSGPEPPRLN